MHVLEESKFAMKWDHMKLIRSFLMIMTLGGKERSINSYYLFFAMNTYYVLLYWTPLGPMNLRVFPTTT